MENHVVYITDAGYFLPTIVSLCSLIHSRVKEAGSLVIHILHSGLSKAQLEQLKGMEREGATLHLLDIQTAQWGSDLRDAVPESGTSATKTSLLKFYIADLLPGVDTALYVDGDTIIKKDLTDLFQTDLAGLEAAAVPDVGLLYLRTLREARGTDYFNSGMMLLNLAAWREHKVSLALHKAKMEETDGTFMDQGALNTVLKGKCKMLSPKYNTMYGSMMREHHLQGMSLEAVNGLYGTHYKKWEDILADSAILHYSSKGKPWKYRDAVGVELWDRYYQLSPFGSKPLDRKKMGIKLLFGLCKHKMRGLARGIWSIKKNGLGWTIRRGFTLVKERLFNK